MLQLPVNVLSTGMGCHENHSVRVQIKPFMYNRLIEASHPIILNYPVDY